MNLSIIIPAYNESRNIVATLQSVYHYVRQMQVSFEIIVVDDGSQDTTVKLVLDYQRNVPEVSLIKLGLNQGKGRAVRTGMLNASGTYRLFMDADSSVSIHELKKFLQEIKNGADVVIGSIHVNKATSVDQNASYRRIAGVIAKRVISFFASTGVQDTQRGFKLFTAKAAEMIFNKQTINRFGFDIELLVIAKLYGLKVSELPVNFNNPPGSTVSLMSYVTTPIELFKVRLNLLKKKY